MIKQNENESRLEYLLRVTIHHLRDGGQTIHYDETECDSFCLADDLENELWDLQHGEEQKSEPDGTAQGEIANPPRMTQETPEKEGRYLELAKDPEGNREEFPASQNGIVNDDFFVEVFHDYKTEPPEAFASVRHVPTDCGCDFYQGGDEVEWDDGNSLLARCSPDVIAAARQIAALSLKADAERESTIGHGAAAVGHRTRF